jgi:EAL and modified HD-GYP domain-containing signal transduction protein
LADYVKLDLMALKPGQLPMPLDQALALLSLPPAVAEALQHGTGIYGPLLALTRACEGDDDVAFRTAADALQFRSHHLNMAHMEALVGAGTLPM